MKRADQFNYPCFYPDEFEESGKRFFDSYRLAVHANSPTFKMTGLRDKSFRTCRFCKKKMPEVTFNNDAHIIPQFLGNKYLISDFECDSCNALFSKYESDFARFLGIHRAMLVEKKSLKFNSSDKNLFVQSSPDSDGHLISMTRVSDSSAFEFDKENQLVKVNYTKGIYRPINVYKSLLKIALSIFDSHSVQDHNATLTFLSDQRDSMMTGFEIVTSYTMPLTFYYQEPVAMLFRKKDPAQNLFTHVFALMVLNHIFQIVVPFNFKDAKFHRPGFVETLWCPPLFGDTTKIQPIFSESKLFNSSKSITDEKGTFVFHQDAQMFEEITFIDKVTGKPYTEKFDPSKIANIEFLRTKIK